MTYGDSGPDAPTPDRRSPLRRHTTEPGESYDFDPLPTPSTPSTPSTSSAPPTSSVPSGYQPAGRSTARKAAKRTSRGWLGALAGVLAVLLLVGFGVGAYFLIDDSTSRTSAAAPSPSGHPATPTLTASGKPDISSQLADPEPITESEIFPTATLAIEERTYAVQKTQFLTDCALGTTGELGAKYTKLGCSQLVRATVISPGKDLIATVGIFNFADQAAAITAKADTKTVLNSGKGAIAGWAAGNGTDVITTSETYLSWLPIGHFLAYSIVARADGTKPDPNDPAVQQVLTDMVENYLKSQVKKRGTA